jgi:hypothetical protein
MNTNIMRFSVKEWTAKDIQTKFGGLLAHKNTNRKEPRACRTYTPRTEARATKTNNRRPSPVLQDPKLFTNLKNNSSNNCIHAPECETGEVVNCPSLKLWMYCWGNACSTYNTTTQVTCERLIVTETEICQRQCQSILNYWLTSLGC